MAIPTSKVTSAEAGTPTHTDAKHPSSDQAEFIFVPEDFKVKEGAKLADNLFVGKALGVGLQGGVFLLQDENGKVDHNQVLKAVFKFGIGGLFGMTNLEREWRVGRQLALLTDPGEALPGFMGTGPGIVTKSGQFRAMILERIVGRDVTNPIGEKGFHDVHYLRQMLFCVFKSLHQAQRKLAFHHADLRLANIMELMPPKDNMSEGSTHATTATGSGRIQDAASHDASVVSDGPLGPAQPGKISLADSATQPYLQAYHPTSGLQQTAPEEAAGMQQPDASRTLQPTVSLQHKSMLSDTIEPNELPHMREKNGNGGKKNSNESSNTPFKIIDFGLADFRETFGAGYVTGKRGKLIHNEPHHLEPLRSNAAQVGNGSVDPGSPAEPHKEHRHKLRGNKGIQHRADVVPEGSKSTKFFPNPSDLLPQVPPVERLYRYFWRRKGDVYALLWDMQRWIDGRVWPDRDELEVRLMMDLFKHVTGVHIKAWFAPLDETDTSADLALKDERSFQLCGAIYRNDGWAHWLRIRSLRIRSFLRPDNPGITAAEALTAPFFTYDQNQGFFLDA